MTKKTPTTTFCITGALEKFKRIDAIVEIHNKTKELKLILMNYQWIGINIGR